MSHVIVHDQSARARARMGRIAQIDALPPQLDRHEGDHWQLNRAQLIRGAYRQQIRPDEIVIGETIFYRAAGEAGSTTAPGLSAPADTDQDSGEQLCFSLWANGQVDTDNQLGAISTRIIPWPYIINGARVWHSGSNVNIHAWNLFTSDVEVSGLIGAAPPQGAPLIEHTNTVFAGGSTTNNFGPFVSNISNVDVLAYPLGNTVLEAGKRLVLVFKRISGLIAGSLQAVITVQRAARGAGTRARAIYVAPSRVAPPPAQQIPQPITQPGEPQPPAAPAAPRPAPPAAACSRAYEFINWGAAYRVPGSGSPGSAWITEAQNLLRTAPTLCTGESQEINDEMNRLLRNFGGSLGLIPIQIAPLISFYQFALQPQARRPQTLTIRAAVISLSSAQVQELSDVSGLNTNYLWSLPDGARVQLAQRWGIL